MNEADPVATGSRVVQRPEASSKVQVFIKKPPSFWQPAEARASFGNEMPAKKQGKAQQCRLEGAQATARQAQDPQIFKL